MKEGCCTDAPHRDYGVLVVGPPPTATLAAACHGDGHGDAISHLSLCLYLPIEIPYEYLAGKLGTAVT